MTNQSIDKTLKALGVLAPYACPAGIQGGVARCRKLVPCPNHPEDAPKAPRPDVVLVKVNVNKTWEACLRKANVALVKRDFERAQQLGAEHAERARKLGRDAFVIRERQNREGHKNEETPESADSGSPVFGPTGLQDGVQGTSVAKLGFQLRDSGFRLVNAHLLMRYHKPPTRLVMTWERTPGKDIYFPWQLFQQLTNTTFERVDVWANDRDSHANVVHTVNCGKRDDSAIPAYRLVFAGGEWEVTEPR